MKLAHCEPLQPMLELRVVFLPEGLLCRRPQNFDVRLFVRACVRASVPLRFDHFLDPDMCDIALNITFDRKKDGKKEVSPQILMVI